jgi:4-hydroxy-3-methylbut-2-enyl diphosphate reductase IspH
MIVLCFCRNKQLKNMSRGPEGMAGSKLSGDIVKFRCRSARDQSIRLAAFWIVKQTTVAYPKTRCINDNLAEKALDCSRSSIVMRSLCPATTTSAIETSSGMDLILAYC